MNANTLQAQRWAPGRDAGHPGCQYVGGYGRLYVPMGGTQGDPHLRPVLSLVLQGPTWSSD